MVLIILRDAINADGPDNIVDARVAHIRLVIL